MAAVEEYVHSSGLEVALIHLIQLRTSQLNGCAFCIDMHWKDLKALGEPESGCRDLDALAGVPYHTDRPHVTEKEFSQI